MFATHPPAHRAFPDLGIEQDPKLFSFFGRNGAEVKVGAHSQKLSLNKRASTRGLLTTVCTSLPTSFDSFFLLADLSVLLENVCKYHPVKL